MIIMPAVVVGGIVVFCLVFYLGYLLTYALVSRIAKNRSAPSSSDRDSFSVVQGGADDWDEDKKGKISFVGGVLTDGVGILLLFSIKNEWALLTWIMLTFIGIFAGLFSFAFWGSGYNPKIKFKTESYQAAGPPPSARPKYSQASRPVGDPTVEIIQQFIIIDCENCSQQLRIPMSDRKLIITCPKCRTSFEYGANPVSVIDKFKTNVQALLKKFSG